MRTGNLFSDLPKPNPAEVFEDILWSDACRIERIVSVKPSLPAEQWYDQGHDEWVLLLRGSAGIRFEGDDDIVIMEPGDYVDIPARCRHRVEWTDSSQETIWLAVHYRRGLPERQPERE